MFEILTSICTAKIFLRDHPYIKSAKGLDGSSSADFQCCIYADIVGGPGVGGSEKVQNYDDVIYVWSLSNHPCFQCSSS